MDTAIVFIFTIFGALLTEIWPGKLLVTWIQAEVVKAVLQHKSY